MSRQGNVTEPTLTEILRAIEAAHPGWHVWKSDGGMLWATTVTHSPYGQAGAGYTVDAGSPECLARKIAEADHQCQSGAAA